MLNKKGEGIVNNIVTICEDINKIMYYYVIKVKCIAFNITFYHLHRHTIIHCEKETTITDKKQGK